MSPQDEHNLVAFLIDLARGITPEDRERVNGRLRGDRPDPSPEATSGQKRPHGGSGTRDGANSRVPRWPVRAWWQRD